jgi:uncharacterized membrane protein YphA (DoxX/SURF4 family)
MNYIQRVEHWGDTHHSRWMDILRIALGLFLCFKGIEFANNMSSLMNLMTNWVPFGGFMLIIVAHYILFAHLLGGFLLVLGLLTRFACLIQIPILLGAIIFVHPTSSDMFGQFSQLSLSVLVLLLLIYFLITGSGPWSLDWNMAKENLKEPA